MIYKKGRFTIEKNNTPRRIDEPKNTSKMQQKGRFKVERVDDAFEHINKSKNTSKMQQKGRSKLERVDDVSMVYVKKTMKLICELKQLLSKFPGTC